MDLNEAKQLLKNCGYRLFKESTGNNYVCFTVTGDMYTRNEKPDSFRIDIVTSDKDEAVNYLLETVKKYGFSDNYAVSVEAVDNDAAMACRQFVGEGNLAENTDAAEVFNELINGFYGDYIGYEANNILEICDYPEISDEEGQTEEDVLNNPEILAKLKAEFIDDINRI